MQEELGYVMVNEGSGEPAEPAMEGVDDIPVTAGGDESIAAHAAAEAAAEAAAAEAAAAESATAAAAEADAAAAAQVQAETLAAQEAQAAAIAAAQAQAQAQIQAQVAQQALAKATAAAKARSAAKVAPKPTAKVVSIPPGPPQPDVFPRPAQWSTIPRVMPEMDADLSDLLTKLPSAFVFVSVLGETVCIVGVVLSSSMTPHRVIRTQFVHGS